MEDANDTRALDKCECFLKTVVKQAIPNAGEVDTDNSTAFARLMPLVEALAHGLDPTKRQDVKTFVKVEKVLLHAMDRAERAHGISVPTAPAVSPLVEEHTRKRRRVIQQTEE